MASDNNQRPVTLILHDVQAGRPGATEELFEMLYAHLRRMAQKQMSEERPGHTLQATGLVNEAFLRLVGGGDSNWDNRNHFYSAASEAMRRILIDIARRKGTQKRGGDFTRFDLNEDDQIGLPVADEILDLDAALIRLEQADPIKAKLVKLRFFSGFSNKEAAEVLGIGVSTAERYWTYSKAWLRQELDD